MIDRRAWEMSEAKLQAKITEMCGELGLTAMHIADARRAGMPGWVDLVIFGTGAIFAELKDMTRTLEPDQRTMRQRIRTAGLQYRLWSPQHLFDGSIAYDLCGISPLDIAALTPSFIERFAS